MKSIKIKHFCRLPLILNILLLVFLPLIGLYLYYGIDAKDGNAVTIAVVLFCVLFTGLGFYLNYGIKINSKWVTVIYWNTFKVFRYDEIVYIELYLDNDSVYGRIKARNQKVFDFYFDEFIIGPNRYEFFDRLLIVKVKLKNRYIEKKKKELLLYDKVRIKEYRR